jgi:hypothetical protein
MTREECVEVLQANLNKAVLVTFADGESMRVMPLTIEEEGFIFDLASAEDIVNWMSYDEVASVLAE